MRAVRGPAAAPEPPVPQEDSQAADAVLRCPPRPVQLGRRAEAVTHSCRRSLLPVRSDMGRFGKVCKLVAFKPFASAADALEQINAVSESNMTDDLKNFLTTNLPKVRCGSRVVRRYACQFEDVSGRVSRLRVRLAWSAHSSHYMSGLAR